MAHWSGERVFDIPLELAKSEGLKIQNKKNQATPILLMKSQVICQNVGVPHTRTHTHHSLGVDKQQQQPYKSLKYCVKFMNIEN